MTQNRMKELKKMDINSVYPERSSFREDLSVASATQRYSDRIHGSGTLQ
jgi:hypothetical protein